MNNSGICSTQLFVAQISEQSISDKAMPCGFAGKKSSLPAELARYFFPQSLVLKMDCVQERCLPKRLE
ncbi:hypothetical protein [Pedobacter ginsengiterrae]|uniref:hypothetical protein n=1 Tax=Pedobacter ginsengiterrae TaxID=871696 RepID=UPI0031DCC6B2